MSSAPVSTGEILDLTVRARELAALGSAAHLEDRIRFFDHKVELLERLLDHGAVHVDRRLTEDALAHAVAMRDQYVELLITGA